ncbi:hypothetical protein FMUND_11444 [Fusarium mundagurra]|uniref:Secreted protein n=1 Tax=Fusarium mundagurra TaxID=1567541 RepID=A0A8H6D7B6_9HYPO|nr:hypothetical protein FMUND_11444 [Fusarium mundagurra]
MHLLRLFIAALAPATLINGLPIGDNREQNDVSTLNGTFVSHVPIPYPFAPQPPYPPAPTPQPDTAHHGRHHVDELMEIALELEGLEELEELEERKTDSAPLPKSDEYYHKITYQQGQRQRQHHKGHPE